MAAIIYDWGYLELCKDNNGNPRVIDKDQVHGDSDVFEFSRHDHAQRKFEELVLSMMPEFKRFDDFQRWLNSISMSGSIKFLLRIIRRWYPATTWYINPDSVLVFRTQRQVDKSQYHQSSFDPKIFILMKQVR